MVIKTRQPIGILETLAGSGFELIETHLLNDLLDVSVTHLQSLTAAYSAVGAGGLYHTGSGQMLTRAMIDDAINELEKSSSRKSRKPDEKDWMACIGDGVPSLPVSLGCRV